MQYKKILFLASLIPCAFSQDIALPKAVFMQSALTQICPICHGIIDKSGLNTVTMPSPRSGIMRVFHRRCPGPMQPRPAYVAQHHPGYQNSPIDPSDVVIIVDISPRSSSAESYVIPADIGAAVPASSYAGTNLPAIAAFDSIDSSSGVSGSNCCCSFECPDISCPDCECPSCECPDFDCDCECDGDCFGDD